MPEIQILRVLQWPGNDDEPTTYTVDNVEGGEIQSETADFGVNDLAELGTEYGITRWSEPTDVERAEFDKFSYVAENLALIGWAEAPISRDDVERSYHQGHNGEPMVNIKVRSFEIPKGELFDRLVDGEFAEELDPKLAQLDRSELRTLVEEYLEKDNEGHIFNFACEDHFEYASGQAKEVFFAKYNVKVWTAGRSGGWLVVEGLPDVESWGPELLGAWHDFEIFCRGLADDIPWQMAWKVLSHAQAELAGRILRFEVALILSDDDLAEIGDPTEWNWRAMLDLGVDSQINVRKLS